MTYIYVGYGLNKTLVGICENGNIYKGSGINKTLVGTYSSNEIYEGYGLNKKFLGIYQNRNVYKGTNLSKEYIGRYDAENIYIGYGLEEVCIGSYEGFEGAIASAALLLLFSPKSNESKYSSSSTAEQKQTKQSARTKDKIENSTDKKETGGSSFIIGFIMLFIIGLSAVIFKQYTEYLSIILYIICPGLIFLISVFCKISGKSTNNLGVFIGGGISGFAIMFVLTFIINAFIHRYSNIQILEDDIAMVLGFVISFLTGGNFATCTKTK